MANSDNLLNDILHFFSKLRARGSHYAIDRDYVIESSVGCFRVAYSPKTHVTALFYARHRDDLAAKEVVGEDGKTRLEIVHKDRVFLVKMYDVHHSTDAKFDPRSEHQQFDLTWIDEDIPEIIKKLPRILFREAALHRLGLDTYGSAFVAYQATGSQGDEVNIDVSTKTVANYKLPEMAQSNGQGYIQKLFRRVGRQLVKRRISPRFPLEISYRDDDGNLVHSRKFPAKKIPHMVLADFQLRLRAIWDGRDPVEWKEGKLIPFFRLKSALQHRMKDGDAKEGLARKGLAAFAHIVLEGGPWSYLGSITVDIIFGDWGKKSARSIPRGWEKIVRPHAKGLKSIQSLLHSVLQPIDPAQLGDLEWLNPKDKHISHFHETTIEIPGKDDVFTLWLRSLFYAPYAATFEYLGKNAEILDPRTSLKNTRMVRANMSNGVTMFYAPTTKILYGYYHKPRFEVQQRVLPPDAGDFFKEGFVLKLDLAHRTVHFEQIPFERLRRDICDLTGAKEFWALPSAHSPPDAPDESHRPPPDAPLTRQPTQATVQ
jgi:hypothetical protein